MARLGGKHLAIKLLGLGESAAIVVAQRRIEEGGGRGPRPDGRIRAGLLNALAPARRWRRFILSPSQA
jgi:hypothetical protein